MEGSAVATHVHDAIRQVRELRRRVLESERFTGYSGRTRAVGGTGALAAAWIMSLPGFPPAVKTHLAGWALVVALAVVANYSALLAWFLFTPGLRRDVRRLIPTVDAFPPLIVGGLFTLVLARMGLFDLLFGVWMCCYGLANLSSRRVLPRAIWPVGIYYIACGAVFLFLPGVSFLRPWPMGLVFFVGEWAGGFVFHFNRMPDAPVSSFFTGLRGKNNGE